MLAALITGTIVSVAVVYDDPALPVTHIEINDESGERVWVVAPGSNGQPPVIVGGVPAVHVGERWTFRTSAAPIGSVPVGLGAGMLRLGGPTAPPWAINGLVYPAAKRPLEMFLGAGSGGGVGSASLGESSSIAILEAALAAWSAVGCSDFEFVYAGTSTQGFADDGLNVVSWEEHEWVWGEGVVGMSATRFEIVDGLPSPAGADVLLNGADYLWVDGPGDLYTSPATVSAGSILAHELGHVAGMDHNLTDVAATMFFAYISGDWQSTLAGDDHRGICETYPAGVDACADTSDCLLLNANGMDHTCVTIDGVGVCDEVRDSAGSFCARTVFNCAEACIFTVPAATEGYCSTRCEGDDDCGAGFACGIPETAFLYDDPSVEGERLCLRAAEPVDTGVVVDSGVLEAQDTSGDEPEGGTPATETGLPPSGGDTAHSVKEAHAKRGCGCTATEKNIVHLLWLWMCLPLLVLARTKALK